MQCRTDAVQCSTLLLELQCGTDAGQGRAGLLQHTARSQPPFAAPAAIPMQKPPLQQCRQRSRWRGTCPTTSSTRSCWSWGGSAWRS
eukprot:12076353-Heterocapsa_arctica.AAC.1